ncbi:MAG: DNA-directed RNA polymerase subunit omega [Pseudomonadota bacterium]|nr:DNA-directed RNA polymerase subunit omega [Pseudomonadota bacterium]
MARVTIEDCLERLPNRFEIVEAATKRARQLALDGADPLVKVNRNNKVAVTALREIAEGLVSLDGTAVSDENDDSDVDSFDDVAE